MVLDLKDSGVNHMRFIHILYVSKGLVYWISNDISVASTSENSKHVGDMLVCLNNVRQPRNSWWMGFAGC